MHTNGHMNVIIDIHVINAYIHDYHTCIKMRLFKKD